MLRSMFAVLPVRNANNNNECKGTSSNTSQGIIEGIKHVLTDDEHFDPLVNLIKPINLKTALKMAR